jgi:hypothetical protein
LQRGGQSLGARRTIRGVLMSTDLVIQDSPLAGTLALVEPSFGLIEKRGESGLALK